MEAEVIAKVVAVVVVVVGSIVTAIVLQRRRLDSRIQRMPRVPIRELVDQQTARITGVVKVREGSLSGPFTGRTCVGYRAHVRREAGEHEKVELALELFEPFDVDDGTATIAIMPNLAQVRITSTYRSDADTFRDPTPHIDATLARLGHDTSLAWKRARIFIEATVEPGDTVEVYGTTRRARGELRMVADEGTALWIAKVPPTSPSPSGSSSAR